MNKNKDSDMYAKVDKSNENISAFSDSNYNRGEHPNSLKNLKHLYQVYYFYYKNNYDILN